MRANRLGRIALATLLAAPSVCHVGHLHAASPAFGGRGHEHVTRADAGARRGIQSISRGFSSPEEEMKMSPR